MKFIKNHTVIDHSMTGKIDEINFSRLKFVLPFPFAIGLLNFLVGRFTGNSSLSEPSPHFFSYLPPLLADMFLLFFFFLSVFNTPKNKHLFNRIAFFFWIFAVLFMAPNNSLASLLTELLTSLVLLNLFIYLEPLTSVLANLSIAVVLLLNYTGYSDFVIIDQYRVRFVDHILFLSLFFFLIVTLTVLSLIRGRDLRNHLSEQDIIEKQNRDLEDAARLRDHIDRIVRHDMKNPLSGIIGMSRLLRENNLDSQEKLLYLDMIEQSGNRLLRLLNASMDLYKMEQGTYVPRKEPFDLTELLREVSMSFCDSIASHNLHLYCENLESACAEQELILYAERDKIAHMLSNLIQNAIEASPPGKGITVAAARDGHYIIIRIHNFGIIPMEIRDRLFEKYVTAGKIHGTGLGTHSAQMIVHAHEGRIGFTTSEEEGTAFTVILPNNR